MKNLLPFKTLKENMICLYFCLSMFSLGFHDSTPIWIVVLVLLNFLNACRVVEKIDFETSDKEQLL